MYKRGFIIFGVVSLTMGNSRGRFRGGVVQHCSMTVAVVESQGYALALGGTAVQIPAAGADYGHGQQGRASR